MQRVGWTPGVPHRPSGAVDQRHGGRGLTVPEPCGRHGARHVVAHAASGQRRHGRGRGKRHPGCAARPAQTRTGQRRRRRRARLRHDRHLAIPQARRFAGVARDDPRHRRPEGFAVRLDPERRTDERQRRPAARCRQRAPCGAGHAPGGGAARGFRGVDRTFTRRHRGRRARLGLRRRLPHRACGHGRFPNRQPSNQLKHLGHERGDG